MIKYLKIRIESFLERIYKRIEQNNIKDISAELSRRALSSTADYVANKMKNVESVNSKWELHSKAIKCVQHLDGMFLEFGVFKGETINFIANEIENKVYGFDSFEGLPEFWRDGFPKGEFFLNELPRVSKNVTLVKGWFDKTIPIFLKDRPSNQIAYLHIDCDLYKSTKTVFELLKDFIVSGTVIVFDEYFNYPNWEQHEFLAFQEFIETHNLNYRYITFNKYDEQVAVIII